MLSVAVLGPVDVRRGAERLAVPSGKTTEVLVRLALDAGRPVRAERMMEDLWGPAAAPGRNTLQSKVSQLRRALGDAEVVTVGSGGYTLHVEREDVDALAVQQLAEAVSSARRAGDDEAVLDRATRALALFRGEALVDVGEGTWLQPHRTRLEEIRLGLVEDRMAAAVALGGGADVIGDLDGLVEQHPLREGLWASLITALYRNGRQAEALGAYARVRRRLVDELGVEPGPALHLLLDRILQHSPALTGGRPAGAPLPLGNLPTLTADLFGRTADLTALETLMRRRRLVTVCGPAGVGKTCTAIEAARRLRAPGGEWLVRLDAIVDATAVGRTVAEALRVPGGESHLLERFAGLEAVLLLDNCEHVLDGVSDLVSRLLDGAPLLRVLATSQARLGLEGEVVHTLAPLPLEESTAMFTARAAAMRASAVADRGAAATVTQVCRSLDGLPLAIELAASRVRSLSMGEIARRLDDRFTLLRDPSSRGPGRRRTLAAAIGWSYDLLAADDQRGLQALSLFAGGAPIGATEQVLGALGVPAESTVDVVGRLADRSLVCVDVSAGDVRYRLLDSVRAFARARLGEAGQETAACAAHARWLAEAADRCAANVRGSGQSACLETVRAERANIDTALAWCADRDPLLGLRVALGFGWAWAVLGDGVPGASRVRGALAAAAARAHPADRAKALVLAGWLEAMAGNVEQAERDLDGALTVADGLGDERLLADAHRHRAFLRIQQGRPRDVLAETEASLPTCRGLGLDWEVAAGLLLAAYGSLMLGDTPGAVRSAKTAGRLLAPIGDSWGILHAQGILGAIAQAERRLDAAAVALSEAAAEAERAGFLGQVALHLTRLGRVEQQRGHRAEAVDTLLGAIAAAGRSGDARIAATARTTLARILHEAGDHVAALALLGLNDEWYRTARGDGALLTRALIASLTSAPDPAAATRRLSALADEAARADDAEAELVALDALARIAAAHGDVDRARHLLEQADRRHASVRHFVDDADRVDARAAAELLATAVFDPAL